MPRVIDVHLWSHLWDLASTIVMKFAAAAVSQLTGDASAARPGSTGVVVEGGGVDRGGGGGEDEGSAYGQSS